MFGIKKWQENVKKSGSKFYIEINPDTEIVRVDDEKQLKELAGLNVVGELPPNEPIPQLLPSENLPQLRDGEVCAHWERELIFLSEADKIEFKKTRLERIVGGYCPDCGKNLGMPKDKWIPQATYKREIK